MQKFLKDWAPLLRMRVVQSKVCNARASGIKVGLIDVFLSKTPAVEPPAETRPIPSGTESRESSRGRVGQRVRRNLAAARWTGGEKGAAAHRARSGFFFTSAALFLGL